MIQIKLILRNKVNKLIKIKQNRDKQYREESANNNKRIWNHSNTNEDINNQVDFNKNNNQM